MKKAIGIVCAFAISCVSAGLGMAGENSVVVIQNDSEWDIDEFYLSSTENENWGPDQFGDFVLEAGMKFELHSIDCDKYDVKLVDEDGDACVVESVRLCADDEVWTITNKDLLGCQEETEEAEHDN